MSVVESSVTDATDDNSICYIILLYYVLDESLETTKRMNETIYKNAKK